MKKFENSDDFDVNPELFHTDLSFLYCENFLSDHIIRNQGEIKCQKPAVLIERSKSLENETTKKTFDQSQSLFKEKKCYLRLRRSSPPPCVPDNLLERSWN